MRAALRRGDLLPRVRTPLPGPQSREWSQRLARAEAPGINTLGANAANVVLAEALGTNVLDVDGNRFLDLAAAFGAAAIGHRNPAVLAAVRRQSSRLVQGFGDVFPHPLRVELAERLAAAAPVDDGQVHFAVSGSDAVEIALKTALLSTARKRVLAFEGGYHGLAFGSLAVTSRAEFRQPFAPWLSPEVTRLAYGAPHREIDALLANNDFAAVVVEPLLGREGIVLPPPGWLAELAGSCRGHGALFIADEIFTGFGRTGTLFALEHDGVRADLVCCGKALGGGLPIGAVIGRRVLMAAWDVAGEALHTGTFVAHPLACAAALAVLDSLAKHDLVARAAVLGSIIAERLSSLRAPGLLAVRGRGLVWAIELDGAHRAKAICSQALDRGIILLCGGPRGRVLQIAPPLVITERQLVWALETLASLL